jgi:alpha-tubulin suppressor-like RCC1 family protein
VQLPDGVNPVSIAAGIDSEMALTSPGQVYAWGANGSDELGTGGPQEVDGTPALVLLGNSVQATAISAAQDQSGGLAIVHRSPVVTAPS